MSFPRIVLIGIIAVFALIAMMGLMKRSRVHQASVITDKMENVQEITLDADSASLDGLVATADDSVLSIEPKDLLPDADLAEGFFTTGMKKLPFVETLTYTSRVPWLKGRPAWIADYASYFETSRHFIARSLNKKPDYFTQKVAPGDRFNVFRKDLNISFYLLVDLSRLKMWFYCVDMDKNERLLVKTYPVGAGRKDSKSPSGCLTPAGKYTLGSKIALYKPGTMGYFQDRKIEMIRVFGTRWIPFDKELSDCSEGARGYGLHGAPWSNDPESGQFVEESDKIGVYDSDGCLRMNARDIEELFSIIITKPCVIELVNDFYEATLPGMEMQLK